MADYQVRKWRPWHRPMAMGALAELLVMEARLYQKASVPLLITRDGVLILAWLLILDWHFRSNPTLQSAVEQIKQHHTRRQRASASKLKTAAESEKRFARRS